MARLNRRHLMGGLALAGATVAASRATAGTTTVDLKDLKKEVDLSCIYHCDFGDPARVRQMITNINNHLSIYDFDPFKIRIVVVAHGQGIKPFLTDLEGTPWAKDAPDPELFARYDGLAQYGVDVLLCRITFKNNKIDLAKARAAPFIKLVPSGVATLGDLQAKGFAYIKVG
jgi:uncharacterized protein